MYDQFYGFRRRPFSLNPDSTCLYQSNKHQTALSLMEYALINEAPFCVITGKTGMGKTTLVRQLMYLIETEYTVGVLTSTHQSFSELLKLILIAFGIDYQEKDQVDLYKLFYKFLINEHSHRRKTVLIIDEAQNLAAETLEELRMLSNINVDRHNALQIILVGQEGLRDRLQQPELTQFAQRVAVDYDLEPLDRIETHAYILHRLKLAGGPRTQQIFGPQTCDAVFGHAGGVPRLINMLCDLALVYGYAEQQRYLGPELINEVVKDKKKGGLLPLAGQCGPLNNAESEALLALHALSEDGLDNTLGADDKNVITGSSAQNEPRRAPSVDRLVVGRIMDEAPSSANQDQDLQDISTQHWKELWFDVSTQMKNKVAEWRLPILGLLRLLLEKTRRVFRTPWNRILEKASKLDQKSMLAKLPHRQNLIRYKRPLAVAVVLFGVVNMFFIFSALRPEVTSGTANAVTPTEDRATDTLTTQNRPNRQTAPLAPNHRARVALRDVQAQSALVEVSMPVTSIEPYAPNQIKAHVGLAQSVVVKRGQTLSDLLAEAYGRYDTELIYSVLRLNPHISSPDLIRVGQTIKLPPAGAVN